MPFQGVVVRDTQYGFRLSLRSRRNGDGQVVIGEEEDRRLSVETLRATSLRPQHTFDIQIVGANDDSPLPAVAIHLPQSACIRVICGHPKFLSTFYQQVFNNAKRPFFLHFLDKIDHFSRKNSKNCNPLYAKKLQSGLVWKIVVLLQHYFKLINTHHAKE